MARLAGMLSFRRRPASTRNICTASDVRLGKLKWCRSLELAFEWVSWSNAACSLMLPARASSVTICVEVDIF